MKNKIVLTETLTRNLQLGIHREFVEFLVDELMLEELLCGEADPVEFFIESVKSARARQTVMRAQRRLDQAKEEMNQANN